MRHLWFATVLLAACGGSAPSVASSGPAMPDMPGMQGMGGHDADERAGWTCPMHSQIHEDAPGKCPICGMTLVPIEEGALAAHDHRALHGGQVGMWGNEHLEYLAADGEYRVWVTNATREPITGGVSGSLVDEGQTVALTAGVDPGLLVGHADGAGTRPVTVTVTADGTTFTLDFTAVGAAPSHPE